MRPVFIPLLICILLWGCERQHDLPSTLYSNSFESARDLRHVEGMPLLSADVPRGGGDSSLYVSGGCMIPHVWITLGPWKHDHVLELRCWAKTRQYGTITMGLADDPSHKVEILVSDTNWMYHHPSAQLACPEGASVILEMNSGGIYYDEMWVDELLVRRIE